MILDIWGSARDHQLHWRIEFSPGLVPDMMHELELMHCIFNSSFGPSSVLQKFRNVQWLSMAAVPFSDPIDSYFHACIEQLGAGERK